jgi:hypothetical protein
MSINLASRLKNIIFSLEQNPFDSFGIDIHVPHPLLVEMRKFLIQCATNEKNGDRIINKELTSASLQETIRKILFKLSTLGYSYASNKDLVEQAVKYSLQFMVKNYPCHLAWSPVNVGIHPEDKTTATIDRQINLCSFDYVTPWSDLLYGIENALFSWSGEKWRVTPLGDIFKSLSLPTGTAYLLLTEMYFSKPYSHSIFEVNPWHISREFLQQLWESENVFIDIGTGNYTLSDLDPNMSFVNRLDDFGLLQVTDHTQERRDSVIASVSNDTPVMFVADELFQVTLTDYGSSLVSQCLKEDENLFSIFIANLISFELAGTKYYSFYFSFP